jgi:hypothetical protein
MQENNKSGRYYWQLTLYNVDLPDQICKAFRLMPDVEGAFVSNNLHVTIFYRYDYVKDKEKDMPDYFTQKFNTRTTWGREGSRPGYGEMVTVAKNEENEVIGHVIGHNSGFTPPAESDYEIWADKFKSSGMVIFEEIRIPYGQAFALN